MPKSHAYLIERKVLNARRIDDYRKVSPALYRSVRAHAKRLHGKTIMHLNATPEGGGVAELLASQVSLERSLGLDSRWFYITAPASFFQATKRIHNLLQGMSGRLTVEEESMYLETNDQLAESFNDAVLRVQPDVIVIHDPQPMPLVKFAPEKARTVLRLHIDLSGPNARMMRFLSPFMAGYDRVIVSSKEFARALPKAVRRRVSVIMPAIDPLSEKNQPMPMAEAHRIMTRLGVDPDRPTVAQVSRFDPWKDPIGVIDAYSMAKQELPGLQLILAGLVQAQDDPEAIAVLEKVRKRAASDPGIILFWNRRQLGRLSVDRFVNAVLTVSRVVVQKSIREGFGLTVTEAMWKGKPVVGGNAHGIRQQITSRKNGLIAKDHLQAARGIVELFRKPKLAARLGKAGRQSVRKKFLLPRYLLENLKTYR